MEHKSCLSSVAADDRQPYKKAPAFADEVLKSAMLSVIVLAPAQSGPDSMAGRADEAVARSLSALVSAAVADLVRDACVVGEPGQRLEKIADHAGCRIATDVDRRRALDGALREARSETIFLLSAGYAPMSGFIDEMSDWLLAVEPRPVALRCEPDTFLQRVFPVLAPIVGIAARRSDVSASSGVEPQTLARSLRASTLRTRARRAL